MFYLLLYQIFLLIVLAIFFYLMLRPIINGAVYFPTTRGSLETIVKFADAKTGEKLADIGSGDGRIIIAFAKQGIEAHGYEINPLLVWQSRWLIKKLGLQNKAFVHWKSFWRVDLSQYNIINIYGIPYIMKRLEFKLKKELKPKAKVISNIYPLPGWGEIKKERGVYLYIK